MVFPVAAVGALAPIIGSALSGVLGSIGAKKQNKMQMQLAREQMSFQERMSSTAHQREVMDLRAAGLNPILSATGGAGSSTPSGSQAQVVNELESTANSALAASRMKFEDRLQRAQIGLLNSSSAKADAEAALAGDSRDLLEKQIAGAGISNAQESERLKGIAAEGQLWEALGAGGKGFQLLGPGFSSALQLLLRSMTRGGR